MATALEAQLYANLIWTFTNAQDLTTPQDKGSLALTLGNLTNGVGANQANTIWHDTRTLLTTASESLDLYDIGGATTPLGTAIANAAIKFLYIRNKSSTSADVLTIGGEGTGAAWNTLFNGSDDNKITLRGGGYLILADPSATGYAVADSTNHLLKIENPGGNSVSYDIVVIGATAA